MILVLNISGFYFILSIQDRCGVNLINKSKFILRITNSAIVSFKHKCAFSERFGVGQFEQRYVIVHFNDGGSLTDI